MSTQQNLDTQLSAKDAATRRWVIITGEYPPALGGVADYTRSVAKGLAATGDEVHILAPSAEGEATGDTGVHVHWVPRGFGPRTLMAMTRELKAIGPPYTLLLQYVPHAFGFKGMNLLFCLWLCLPRQAPLWIMFHEIVYPLTRKQSLKHNFLGVVTRIMAWLILHRAQYAMFSILEWQRMAESMGPRRLPKTWLPVPSNVETAVNAQEVAAIRSDCLKPPQNILLGHFGTYGKLIVPLLNSLLAPELADHPERMLLLVGRNSREFAADFVRNNPALATQITATGDLVSNRVSAHLAACDLLIQPYPGGVCCRRGSLMAGLALGVPAVTTIGPATEPLWAQTGAVAMVPEGDFPAFVAMVDKLLIDSAQRKDLSRRGSCVYREHFSVEKVINALRSYN